MEVVCRVTTDQVLFRAVTQAVWIRSEITILCDTKGYVESNVLAVGPADGMGLVT